MLLLVVLFTNCTSNLVLVTQHIYFHDIHFVKGLKVSFIERLVFSRFLHLRGNLYPAKLDLS